MYDSIIYGNGLTISIMNKIESKYKNLYSIKYLDFNNFLKEFIISNDHCRIVRKFKDCFDVSNSEINNNHIICREQLKKEKEEICKLGFERWFSKYMFDKNDESINLLKHYLYGLYNYWYSMIKDEVLDNIDVKDYIYKISCEILEKIKHKDMIFTTNFDTLIDDVVQPKHLHGRFIVPLKKLNQIVLRSLNEFELEYKYLFGTNGLEKADRLKKINDFNQDDYDLDFFFGDIESLGHLLIYGLSFGDSKCIKEKHKDLYFVKSVDGHILLRLNFLYKLKKVDKITISYYSENDLIYLKQIIGTTDFKDIVEYINCSSIF